MKLLEMVSVANISDKSRFLDRLSRPEYTGRNRCIPCTVVNIALATVISAVVAGLVGLGGGRFRIASLLAIAIFLPSLAWIYLRGYLVPYTPTLTKRYFPDRVLRWFDTHHGTEPLERADDFDVEEFLLGTGLLTECDTRDDWCLDSSFLERWEAEMDRIDTGSARQAAIADLLDADPDRLTVLDYGSATAVNVDGRTVGQWESDAAFLADLAADSVLARSHDEWESFHLANRSQVLNSLRMFLETCPSCGAPLSMAQETVESCCRSFDVIAVTCQNCESRVFELEAEQLAEEETP